MKTIGTLPWKRGAMLLCLSAAGLSQIPAANASMVLMESSVFFDSQSQMVSFVAPSAGTFTAQLADLAWPQPLSALSFTASSASEVLSSWTMTPSNVAQTYFDTFTVDQGGTYWAKISGVAGLGALNMGAYGISVSFAAAAVPLPASAWMLLGGVLLFAGFGRMQGFLRRFGDLRYAPLAQT